MSVTIAQIKQMLNDSQTSFYSTNSKYCQMRRDGTKPTDQTEDVPEDLSDLVTDEGEDVEVQVHNIKDNEFSFLLRRTVGPKDQYRRIWKDGTDTDWIDINLYDD